MNLKLSVLKLSEALGLYRAADKWTRQGLRILCYHGLSLHEGHRFLPKLFMPPEMFRRRMQWLADSRMPVLPLDEAVTRLEADTLPDRAVVLTFDDGFFSQITAAEILKELGFPATFYITTYYVDKGGPIFRLLVRYLLWKTQVTSLSLNGLLTERSDSLAVKHEIQKENAWHLLTDHGESRLNEPERRELGVRLAERLEVDLAPVIQSRELSLMGKDEIAALARQGFDIQLHTHRHRCPTEREALASELQSNREVLEPLAGKRLRHLCYPSGIWSDAHLTLLPGLDVKSATTCDTGLNYAHANPFTLKRFLDATNLPEEVFRAELTGYLESLRRLKGS